MDENSENTSDRVGGLRIRSEEIGFAPGDMVVCKKCEKTNPPTRTNCLYCGGALDHRVGSIGDAALNVRELEGWEKGFNVVIVSTRVEDTRVAAEALGRLLGGESEIFDELLSSGKRVPVARMESEGAAFSVGESLSRSGIETKIVPDEDLQPTVPHTRLRGMSFDEGTLFLELFNTGDVIAVPHDDLALVVPGTLRTDRTELMEQRKKKVTKTLSETQTSASEQVIDIYSRQDPVGWRVRSNGFDFSCLDDKSLLVVDNMDRLLAKIAGISASIKVVDDFIANERLLQYCWPAEHRKDAFGFQRSGFSRKDLSSVVTVSNELQLTKYSRLQWHLL